MLIFLTVWYHMGIIKDCIKGVIPPFVPTQAYRVCGLRGIQCVTQPAMGTSTGETTR